ncbi:MAG TPA: hypothetical protein VGD71_13440 [Kribbella sp.]|jgi:hypothetical protein
MEQAEIDTGIQQYYSTLFDEDARLTTRSAPSALKLIRVQETGTGSHPDRAYSMWAEQREFTRHRSPQRATTSRSPIR